MSGPGSGPGHDKDSPNSPKKGGILGSKIKVYGDWLPRKIPGLGATALCSAVRLVYVKMGYCVCLEDYSSVLLLFIFHI